MEMDYIDKKKLSLVSIGRMVPYKGFEFLIDTFSNSEFELNIIGNGPLEKKIRKYISKMSRY